MKTLLKAMLLTAGVIIVAPTQADGFCTNNSLIHNQFKQLDTNRDGLIDKTEVNAQPDVVNEMVVYESGSFEMGDINADGALDWQEFLANEEMLPVE